jgi:ketosteroid isomerase-like protein
MPVQLHPAIAAYFAAANAHDTAALLRAFAPDALVIDEQIERRGLEAIGAWEEETYGLYRPVMEPLSAEQAGDGTAVVTARVSGSFPGSPVDLRFAFRLAGEVIARLEITQP